MAMNYLSEWVSQLVLIVLFAVILELLLPANGFQKYVKFVIGLVLIVALMDPIIRLFQIDPGDLIRGIRAEQTNGNVQNETARQKKEIENAQAAYIHEQVAVQLKDRVKEELDDKYRLQIKDIQLSGKQVNGESLSLDKVIVFLGQAPRRNDGTTESRIIQPVKDVSVDLAKDPPFSETKNTTGEIEKVRSFLAERWEIDKHLISIHLEGGDSDQ
ncbi:stage III sporulation protein AF [Sporolactobacillus sp. THM7-4]|nr:stage III sporulation protein AF [Sporolactobacillus sp. THM7-4]